MNPKTGRREPDGAPVEIKPVSFRVGRSGRRRWPGFRLKGIIGVFLGVLILFLAFSAWYVFTARQVVIRIDPRPDEIEIEGTLAAPRLGAYYLLHPGKYTIHAESQCFYPLEKRFEVGDAKSQQLQFSMIKLPGRISFQAHRVDKPAVVLNKARFIIGGEQVADTSSTPAAVIPGPHTVEIRAPNYQVLQQEIRVEGCGTLQKFDWALVPGWSDITVDSVPPDAIVTVDGKPAGKTPLTLELFAGVHEIELKGAGYKLWRTRLEVEANHPRVLDPVQLQPADGMVTVQSTPEGANVLLADSFVGQTPIKLSLPANKNHRIQLSKPGYKIVNRELQVESAAEKTLIVALKPITGLIELTVAPGDALIAVDGKAIGRVPPKLRLIAVEHQLEITREGYQPYRTRVTPRPGFTQEIRVTLLKQKTPESASSGIITAANGYKLKLVQPRAFTMGSSRREQGRRSNETLRRIDLQRPFYMGLREVTNAEFRQFQSGHNSGKFENQSLDADPLAAVNITWKQAALFCNWLSIKESLPPVYSEKDGTLIVSDPIGIGYRLPTEAEWEYCARFNPGGTLLKYPWGFTFPPTGKAGNFGDISAKDLLPSYLQSYNDGYAVTAPPQKFSQSALGFYDLGGNATEWTHDYYSIYPYDAGKIYFDPRGPAEGKHHVVRGSGWMHSGISELRLSYRDYSSTKRPDLGFRVCRYFK